MINSINSLIGGAIIAGSVWFATNPLFNDPPFMVVHEISYKGGQIEITRTINVAGMVADWSVTVVGETRDAPYCQTIPSREIDNGWSIYESGGKATKPMPLDVWVGDPGCLERLTPGRYKVFVTWTPRDGSEPVSEITEIGV